MHHWIRTKELVEAALDQPTDNRIAFVRATCGDESVCNDAIRLLNDLQTGSQFLQSRPGLIAGEFLASAAMPQFDAGDVLAGRFEIRRFLGRGGMGDVYEAADIQGRNTRVALKTIRSTLAGSNTLLSRLVDELIISRGVTHRNVCRVFDLHVHTPTTGVPAELLFVTMELLEGETLAERLVRCGPLSLDEGLVILYQLAAGLCAVHDAGVAHGDVKPGNVMLASQSGQTRTVLMDFGVAGAPRSPSPDQAGLAPAPGTPAYMAPEQAAGVITPASDIYSFGVLACEALTGTRPDAQSDRTRHIGPLRIGARAGMPEWLDSALRRCLRPDPPTRYQHARELLALFQRHGRFQDTGDFPVAPRSAETRGAERPASRRRMLVAGSVALLAAGVAWWVWSGAVSPQEPTPQAIPLTTSSAEVWRPSISADGTLVAYELTTPPSSTSTIYVQRVGETTPVHVTTQPGDHFSPALSPDGRFIAHFHTGKLMVIPTWGGPERKIADLDCTGCAFPGISYTPDGKSVAVCEYVNGGSSIVSVALDTGRKTRITTPPAGQSDYQLVYSPDGRKAALLRAPSVDAADIYVMPAGGGAAARITAEKHQILGLAWAADSRELVFGSSLHGFVLKRVSVKGGAPQPVAGASGESMWPSISHFGGRLAYVSGSQALSVWRMELSKPGHTPGRAIQLLSSIGHDLDARYSPDGRKIAFVSDRTGDSEAWVANADGSGAVRLTSLHGAGSPCWSPDGKRIAFDSVQDGISDIWTIGVDGKALTRIRKDRSPANTPAWSRDGRWIYYVSGRTWEPQLWKVDPNTGEEVQLTFRGGHDRPLESHDGRVLYFARPLDHDVWKLPVGGGPEVPAMISRDGSRNAVFGWNGWDVAEDGIYFIHETAEVAGAPPAEELRFFDFRSRAWRVIQQIPFHVSPVPGLSVSPDRRAFLFGTLDDVKAHLMLINNFR